MNNEMKKAEREKLEKCKQVIALARLLTAAGLGKVVFSPERIDKEVK